MEIDTRLSVSNSNLKLPHRRILVPDNFGSIKSRLKDFKLKNQARLWKIDEDNDFINDEKKTQMLKYLIEQIDITGRSSRFEIALWALLRLERMLLDKVAKKYWIDQEQLRKFIIYRKQLFSILNSNAKNCNNPAKFDSAKNQFEFCCAWLLDRIKNPSALEQLSPNPQTLDTKFRSPYLKLSRDLLSARSDWDWQSAKSVFEMNQIGSYYYEATVVTDGQMRIGLSTKQTFLQGELVGENECSIGLDCYNQCVWHDGQKWLIKCNHWKVGDIVGFLIDLKTRKFKFSLNGDLIFDSSEYKKRPHFSGHPYSAAMSLFEHQQVRVNFGQEPFQYRPKYLDLVDVGNCFSGNGNHYINAIINTGEMQFKSFNADYSVGGGFSPMRYLRNILTW